MGERRYRSGPRHLFDLDAILVLHTPAIEIGLLADLDKGCLGVLETRVERVDELLLIIPEATVVELPGVMKVSFGLLGGIAVMKFFASALSRGASKKPRSMASRTCEEPVEKWRKP